MDRGSRTEISRCDPEDFWLVPRVRTPVRQWRLNRPCRRVPGHPSAWAGQGQCRPRPKAGGCRPGSARLHQVGSRHAEPPRATAGSNVGSTNAASTIAPSCDRVTSVPPIPVKAAAANWGGSRAGLSGAPSRLRTCSAWCAKSGSEPVQTRNSPCFHGTDPDERAGTDPASARRQQIPKQDLHRPSEATELAAGLGGRLYHVLSHELRRGARGACRLLRILEDRPPTRRGPQDADESKEVSDQQNQKAQNRRRFPTRSARK